jgi:hypothetical protein
MDGIRRFVCSAFIETETYAQSRNLLGHLTDEEIDDRLSALLWALGRDPEHVAARVGQRNLWVAVYGLSTTADLLQTSSRRRV